MEESSQENKTYGISSTERSGDTEGTEIFQPEVPVRCFLDIDDSALFCLPAYLGCEAASRRDSNPGTSCMGSNTRLPQTSLLCKYVLSFIHFKQVQRLIEARKSLWEPLVSRPAQPYRGRDPGDHLPCPAKKESNSFWILEFGYSRSGPAKQVGAPWARDTGPMGAVEGAASRIAHRASDTCATHGLLTRRATPYPPRPTVQGDACVAPTPLPPSPPPPLEPRSTS
jgi:hypothetical protein